MGSPGRGRSPKQSPDRPPPTKAGAGASFKAGGAAVAGGVVPSAAIGGPADDEEEGEEEEGEEEEETEESQVMWGAIIGFLPVIIEIAVEFGSTAFEAGICQYLAMIMLPIWSAIKSLVGAVTAPAAPPAYAPPAPPPPPTAPDLVTVVSTSVFTFAEAWPVTYLSIDLLLFVLAALFFLYLKDISDYLEARKQAQRQLAAAEKAKESGVAPPGGYARLVEEEVGGSGGDADEDVLVDMESADVKSAAELARELRTTVEKCEVLEVRARVFRKAVLGGVDWAVAMRDELTVLQARREELKRITGDASAKEEEKPEAGGASGGSGGGGGGAGSASVGGDGEKKKKTKAKPEPPKSTVGKDAANGLQKVLKGPVMSLLMKALTGIMAISLYFMDIISDIQVIVLLWGTNNLVWAWMSIFLLVAQFAVVYARVIPYMNNTFGRESPISQTWLFFGFPLGLLFLDFLMFLEPFGLLTVLPFPAWLKQFLPAYKATRVIAEVVIESLPQSILQAVIYVIVIKSCGPFASDDATCAPNLAAMMASSSTLPKSILISTLATLKTWVELVFAARAAGLTVLAKGFQLWHVGAGLPLDALKKGTIQTWACPYKLDPSEVQPLIDALSKNGSLTMLNLGASGIAWNSGYWPEVSPSAAPQGLPLVEKMNHSIASLSSCVSLIIREEGFRIPTAKLREPETALEAIREEGFFTEGGPQRLEIVFMGDLLRKDELTAEEVRPMPRAGSYACSSALPNRADTRPPSLTILDYIPEATFMVMTAAHADPNQPTCVAYVRLSCVRYAPAKTLSSSC